MRCTIRSADRTYYEGDAQRIVARSPHGEFAVMEGHAPMLSVLATGPVRIQDAETEHVLICKTGTFSLDNNQITILVEQPYTLDEIDVSAIREQLASTNNEEAASTTDSDEAAYLELLCQMKERHA